MCGTIGSAVIFVFTHVLVDLLQPAFGADFLHLAKVVDGAVAEVREFFIVIILYKIVEPFAGKVFAFKAKPLAAELDAAFVDIACIVPGVAEATTADMLGLEPGAHETVHAARRAVRG